MNAKKLKDSILQYAVQGNLVDQNPNDEPVNQLIESIHTEKEELIHKKLIKKAKELPHIVEEEIPFEIPPSWQWIRLGEVTNFIDYRGKTPKKIDSGIRLITAKNIKQGFISLQPEEFISEEEYNSRMTRGFPQVGDIFFTTEAPLGNMAINNLDESFTTAQRLITIHPLGKISSKFLMYSLMSKGIFNQIRDLSTGTTVKGIKSQLLKLILIPVPPYDEQLRIVSKIEELFSKIEQYDFKYLENQKLINDFPSKLEKSILQHAIQGKLVEQNENDDPASQLIELIKEEKEKLVEQKAIKKEKPLPPITVNEIPFEIPESWEWVRLNEISTYIQRGKSPKYSLIKKVPVISQKCIQWSGFTIEPAKFIEPDTLEKYDKIRFLQSGDLLWNSTGLGTIGRVALYKDSFNPYEQAVADSHVTVVRISELIDSQYVYYYLASPEIQNAIEDISSGSTKQKELNTSTIKSILVPIPPFEEQKRIVDKINELLNIKKRLQ
ncbi:restriction endonuclease subunit S [Priestia megaterium]|uniref:restriction endonuclease subunit S n=1 Tax=Priestia megaterium TaxID=1404 RepID=UPI0012B6F76D|nr:restriction endonuclease subunit S [Priestia megaterium]